MDKSKSISQHKHPPTPHIAGLKPTGHVASSTTNAGAGTNPADPKAKLQSTPKRSSGLRTSLMLFRPRREEVVSRVRHRSMDPADVVKNDRHNELNETLYELGFSFVGDQDSRKEWDRKLAAGSHKAKRATPDEPQHSSAAPRRPTSAPPSDPPPPLKLQMPKVDTPKSALSDVLSPLTDGGSHSNSGSIVPTVPAHKPAAPSTVTTASTASQVLPAAQSATPTPTTESHQVPDQEVKTAIARLDVSSVEDKKAIGAVSRLADVINSALAPLTPADNAVQKAKAELAAAKKALETCDAKRYSGFAKPKKLKDAEEAVNTAQTKLGTAEVRYAATAKALRDAGARGFNVKELAGRTLRFAKDLVLLCEADVENWRSKVAPFDSAVEETLKSKVARLEEWRAKLAFAEAYAEVADEVQDHDTSRKKTFDALPDADRDLANALFKMNLATAERFAWSQDLFRPNPEADDSTKQQEIDHLSKVQKATAQGAQILPRFQLLLNELLAEGVSKANDSRVQGVQREIRNYLGEEGSLLTILNNALDVLSQRGTDPMAAEFRADLQSVIDALRKPDGIAASLRLIAQAEAGQATKLFKEAQLKPAPKVAQLNSPIVAEARLDEPALDKLSVDELLDLIQPSVPPLRPLSITSGDSNVPVRAGRGQPHQSTVANPTPAAVNAEAARTVETVPVQAAITDGASNGKN